MSNADSYDQKTGIVTGALQEHQKVLRAFVTSRVPSSGVDDLLQSAALRAIEGASSLEDPAKVLPWLYRIHRNIIVDRARADSSHRRMLDRFERMEAQASLEEEVETCACSLHLTHTLPSNYAEILELVDVQEHSLSQAAAQLGITPNNATVRLHRARKALRETLAQHCGVKTASECVDCRCVHDSCCPV